MEESTSQQQPHTDLKGKGPEFDPDMTTKFTVSAIKAAEKATFEGIEKKKTEERDAKEGKKKDGRNHKDMERFQKMVTKKAEEQAKIQQRLMKEEEEIEKKDVFHKINIYLERFPDLVNKIPKLSPRMSLGEAQEILELIRESRNSSGSMRSLVTYCNFGFATLENFVGDGSRMPPLLQYNVKGIAAKFRQGAFPELEPIMAEIDIEYPWLGRRPLLMRLVGTLAEIIVKVHMFNTNPAARKIIEMGQAAPVQGVDLDGQDGLDGQE
jgi:hypothetical protein